MKYRAEPRGSLLNPKDIAESSDACTLTITVEQADGGGHEKGSGSGPLRSSSVPRGIRARPGGGCEEALQRHDSAEGGEGRLYR